MSHFRRSAPALLVTFAVLTLALAGCGDEVQPTASPGEAPPAAAAAPSPTATPEPSPAPTETPIPTETPAPTPTPVFQPGVVILPTVAPSSPTPEPTPTLKRQLDAIDIKMNVSRGLSFKGPIERVFLTPQELMDHLRRSLEADRERIQKAERLYRTLGILDEGVDLFELELALLSEGAFSSHDATEERLYLVETEGGLDPAQVRAYTRELANGLQSQHFDTVALLDAAARSSDALWAARGLVDGDASIAGIVYLNQYLSQQERDASSQQPTDAFIAAFRASPRIVQRQYIFPFQEAFNFAVNLYGLGGFPGVDAAYQAIPQSTEQVLHPEKYNAGEAPVDVALPPLLEQFGEGWSLIDEDTLGEFLLQAYLEEHLDPVDAAIAAEGWGGDRLALLGGPNDQTVLLMKASWDTEDDAGEFANAIATVIQAGAEATWEQLEDGALKLALPDQLALMVLAAETTVVIFAPDEATLAIARAALAEETEG